MANPTTQLARADTGASDTMAVRFFDRFRSAYDADIWLAQWLMLSRPRSARACLQIDDSPLGDALRPKTPALFS